MKKYLQSAFFLMLFLPVACEQVQPVMEETFVTVLQKEYELDGLEQLLEVSVTKNTDYELLSKPRWVSFLGESAGTKSTRNVRLLFKVSDCLAPESRNGEVKLQYYHNDGQRVVESFSIVQHAAELDSELQLVYRDALQIEAPYLQGLDGHHFKGFVQIDGKEMFGYQPGAQWKLSSGRHSLLIRGLNAGSVHFRNLEFLEEIDFSEF